ncbi:SurA N-terminal domain-containing protein [Elusimicrobiota bacterium]
MNSLRKHMKKVMWVIAVLFIAGMFFWYGKIGGLSNSVASINGTKIELKDFHKQITQQLRRIRETQEEELTDEQILMIRRDVLSSMITQEVLHHESKKFDITVSDEEVIQTIHNLPQFQEEGKFNFNLYINSLKYSFGMSPEEFETMLIKDISNRKLERMILSSTYVTNTELKLRYIDKNQNMDGFEENIEELKNEIIQNKRTAVYRYWLTNIQRNSKIDVNTELAGLAQ